MNKDDGSGIHNECVISMCWFDILIQIICSAAKGKRQVTIYFSLRNMPKIHCLSFWDTVTREIIATNLKYFCILLLKPGNPFYGLWDEMLL